MVIAEAKIAKQPKAFYENTLFGLLENQTKMNTHRR